MVGIRWAPSHLAAAVLVANFDLGSGSSISGLKCYCTESLHVKGLQETGHRQHSRDLAFESSPQSMAGQSSLQGWPT